MQLPISTPPKIVSEKRVGSLLCAIEYPKGTIRGGKTWRSESPADYGYIFGHIGADGDEIDCYIGDCLESQRVYVVNQTRIHALDTFDEHKVMLGFASKEEALATYMAGHDRSTDIFHSMVDLSMQNFIRWLNHGDLTLPLMKNVAFASSASVRTFV